MGAVLYKKRLKGDPSLETYPYGAMTSWGASWGLGPRDTICRDLAGHCVLSFYLYIYIYIYI